MRLNAIKILSSEHKISTLCFVLDVNRSTYYKFRRRQPSKRDIDNISIRTAILEIYAKSDKRMGAYKVLQCLKREYCIDVSIGKIYRLMKSMNLPKMSTIKPKVKYIPADDEHTNLNILSQNFNPPAPNMVWVSDITYIKVAGKHYYLCIIIDLFSRKVIAFRLSHKIDRFLVIDTLNDAVATRDITNSLMFHSDQGSQYTSYDFRKTLDLHGLTQSFSAKGHPYDNAVAESFFKYLKKEEVNRRNYKTLNDLKLSLFEYIHSYYNDYRPHSHNDGLTPNQAEINFNNFTCPLT